jgi:hypothetical protein
MDNISNKINKYFQVFVKWLGIIFISVNFVIFLAALIIQKDITTFLIGITIDVIIGGIWFWAYKRFTKRENLK